MMDARAWLRRSHQHCGRLILSYSKRYHVSENVAFFELCEIGFYDQVQIEMFERDGIEWEYKMDGYSGELKVVPKGTEEWDLFQF